MITPEPRLFCSISRGRPGKNWRKNAYDAPITTRPVSACSSRMCPKSTPPSRLPSLPQRTNSAAGWPKYSLSPKRSTWGSEAYFFAKPMIVTSSELTWTGHSVKRST